MIRDASKSIPAAIGPYAVLEQLGEGGMADVYLAQQSEPVRRQVAVKMLKAGMDSKQILARFESERQALAVLDHARIAKVFDAGVAENGRPYFVMEYVDGVPITEFCDAERLSTKARLRIFIDVCRAVQHAHLKGLIHRDLKPSNILVGRVDGKPRPKVIDFGVAKAAETSLTEATPETRIGQVVGTPNYMSPEQIGAGEIDIDTRTDVYSLGVVLYELLTGALPLDLSTVRNIALPAVIQEKIPPAPSGRFTALGETRAEIASARAADPQQLQRALQGDLDWIVMKSIEKDRERRYETANALAMDCERHLGHEPVLARPPSARYRLGRFVRRNQVLVAAASIAVVALIGLVFVSINAAATSRQQAKEIAAQRDVAEASLAEAQAVRSVMEDILLAAEPNVGLGPDATILNGLDSIVDRFGDGDITGVTSVDATVRLAIGNVYTRLGRYDDAEVLVRRAHEDRLGLLGEDHPDVAETLFEMAEIELGRAQFETAAELYQQALDIRRVALDPMSPRIAATLNRLGWALANQGNVDAARAALEESIASYRVQEGATVDLADPISNLMSVERLAGDLERAEQLAREALAIRERELAADHTKMGESYNNLAVVLDDLGQREEAIEYYRLAIEVQEAIYGEDSEFVAASLGNLGIALRDAGRPDEAVQALLRAWNIDRKALGEDHLYVALDRQNLASTYCASGQPDRGSEHIEATMAIYDTELDEDHWQKATARSIYGLCLWRIGREEQAAVELAAAVDRLEREFGADNVSARIARERLELFLAETGREPPAGL